MPGTATIEARPRSKKATASNEYAESDMDRAEEWGDLSMWWFGVAGDPTACIVQSANSGNYYLLAYDAYLGAIRCSCIAGRKARRNNVCRCKHVKFHAQEWMEKIYRDLPKQTSPAWDALEACGGNAALLLERNNFGTAANVAASVPAPAPMPSKEEMARRRAADWD